MARPSKSETATARRILGRDEPSFNMMTSENIDLIKALNHYSKNKNYDDSKNWLIEWAQVNRPDDVKTLHHIHPHQITNIGFVCRCFDNGFLDDVILERVNKDIDNMIIQYERVKALKVEVKESIKESAKELKPALKKPEFNSLLEQFDYAIDAVMMKKEYDPILFSDNKKHLSELHTVATTVQTEVHSFPDQFINVKLIKKFLKETIDKIETFTKSVKLNRMKKVSKRKADPVKMTSQIVIGADPDTAFKSLKATTIIGATKLIVWHPEKRVLTAFIAMNENGFLVSGRSLKNFDPEKSLSKRIRKPSEMWEAIKDLTATRIHYWLRDTCKNH